MQKGVVILSMNIKKKLQTMMKKSHSCYRIRRREHGKDYGIMGKDLNKQQRQGISDLLAEFSDVLSDETIGSIAL